MHVLLPIYSKAKCLKLASFVQRAIETICSRPSISPHAVRRTPQLIQPETTKAKLLSYSTDRWMAFRIRLSYREPVIGTYKIEEGIANTNFQIKNKLSPRSQRKKSKKIVSRDESSSLDALLALAKLPTSMLPTPLVESDEKSSAPEAPSIGHHRDKTNHVGPKEKVHSLITRAEDDTCSKSKVGSYSAAVNNVVFELRQQPEPTNNSKKRNGKSFITSQVAAEYYDFCNSNLEFMAKSFVQAADFKSRRSN
ncbi:hypothetical protein V6N13_079539 [Hibiscus sabdariffa]|uniref:Uncharacterized protein n=1 Tax=Hibiscus sabdariffa TaxID=183260 RepID=A0ABR2RRT7_9ROSI